MVIVIVLNNNKICKNTSSYDKFSVTCLNTYIIILIKLFIDVSCKFTLPVINGRGFTSWKIFNNP